MDETATLNVLKVKEKADWLSIDDQIGSDEVGVGDFFLPMIVVADCVKTQDIGYLKMLGINDSKKLSDNDILEIVPKFINKIQISKLTLTNQKYNEMVSKGENINTLKAKMHNQALKNLHQSNPEINNIFIDQFVAENTYYKYLINDNPLQDIVFKTKGESFYPSIACASMVARYCFLKEKEKLEEKYSTKIPFGASKKVNEFAKEFIKKFGQQEFDKNLLLSINNDFDENRLVEINQCFFSLFDSLLPKELKNIIMSSITPFESQLKFISKMRNTFYKDLSMIDYLQCSSFLADLINEYSIDSIYATEHSKTFVSTIVAARCRMPVKFFNIKFNHQTISESENNHRTLLLNNLMVICDYGWNCLHNSESVETLSEHDRYLIIYLWLLFQSNYSNWMIASVDFAKIRKLLEDSNKPLMD